MSNPEHSLEQHSNRSATSPSSPTRKSEVSSDLSSNRLIASSRLPTPPQLQHHGPATNTINSVTSFKKEQSSESFEPTNLKCSNLSPTNTSGSIGNKRQQIYSGTNQFSSALSDSPDNSAQAHLSNGYALNSPAYHHHSYHPIHQQHPAVSPLSSPMPNEIGNQSQHSLRNDEPYHSHHHHHPSLYDSQLLLHHHANAHSHHFNHEVPIGVNPGIGNNLAHHSYIQSPSPHPFHQGGNHPNIHQSHFEPEDYSPGKNFSLFVSYFSN